MSLKTGRIGKEAPAEHIIANIVAVNGAYILPLAVPFVHRYSRRVLVRTVILLSMVSGLAMAVFSARSPFDPMHQKRIFVIHMENVSFQMGFVSAQIMNSLGLRRLRVRSNICTSQDLTAHLASTTLRRVSRRNSVFLG